MMGRPVGKTNEKRRLPFSTSLCIRIALYDEGSGTRDDIAEAMSLRFGDRSPIRSGALNGLGELVKRGLLEKENKTYRLTDAGLDLTLQELADLRLALAEP